MVAGPGKYRIGNTAAVVASVRARRDRGASAADLIERSVRTGRTIKTEYAPGIAVGLYEACEDMTYIDGGLIVEYTGTEDPEDNPDARIWTVHMVRPDSAACDESDLEEPAR